MPPKRQQTLAPGSGAAPAAKRPRSVREPGAGETVLGGGAVVRFFPRAFAAAEARELLQSLTKGEVEWLERSVRVFGKLQKQPRLVAFQADDESLKYTYSLQEELESRCGGATFNSCLLNYYRDGNDNMGFHSDDEPLYGPRPTIGSVSFGQQRDFVLKLKTDPSQRVKYSLGDGHLLIMEGTTQEHWLHGVPKRTGGLVGGRINLTFRNVLFPEAEGGPSKKGKAGK